MEANGSGAPVQRKRGRPKGSKDGPRLPGAPPRGRPKKTAVATGDKQGPDYSAHGDSDDEYDVSFGVDLTSAEVHAELNSVPALSGLTGTGRAASPEPRPATPIGPSSSHTSTTTALSEREALDDAVQNTQSRVFFSTRLGTATCEDADDEGGADSDSGEDEVDDATPAGGTVTDDAKAWFRQPAYMSDTVYAWFGVYVKPLLRRKAGVKLARPVTFETRQYAPASMWVEPGDPIFALSRHKFDPTRFHLPRVFLWLPHFFADLLCPHCKRVGTLEKNGATPPRRIIDVEDNYYIITWQYFCRSGCKSYVAGWSSRLMDTLPRWLRPSFPAILSSKSGLDRKVVSLLRVANQHKMGPSGVRSLLFEQHTHRFNRLLLQYLEAALEVSRLHDSTQSGIRPGQPTLHSFLAAGRVPDFGDFGDVQGYGGFVPSAKYLTSMMNRAIELDENAANQHTALLAPDQIAIDDSHKITKHIAKDGGVPVFRALWTLMDSRYIRAQVLTLTKAHDERMGPLAEMSNSMRQYGYQEPPIAFSDDPLKDKAMLFKAFPSLAENLKPAAAAHGLEELVLPRSIRTTVLDSPSLIEATMSALLNPLDLDPASTLVLGFDAEWNISKTTGVSIIQLYAQSQPEDIYIIPVHRLNGRLPPSLLRILVSPNVYKVGSAIKADFTRLKKQFPVLGKQKSFNLIDLKEYCIRQGLLARNRTGSLDALVKQLMNKYLPKEESSRKSEDWECSSLPEELRLYAALDVYATLKVYEVASQHTAPALIDTNTPAGTRVTLYTQDGGLPIAHGSISSMQPSSFQNVRIKVPSKRRILIDVDHVLMPTASATLHLLPRERSDKHNAGTFTIRQVQSACPPQESGIFQMVALTDHLRFYNEPSPTSLAETTPRSTVQAPEAAAAITTGGADLDDEGEDEDELGKLMEDSGESEYPEYTDMLQAAASTLADEDTKSGSLNAVDPDIVQLVDDTIARLEAIVSSTPTSANEVYSKIKKDIFHAFHSLPLSRTHGASVPFLRTLRDHILRWDPEARKQVDKICKKVFNLSFEAMLARNPRWITKRTPRYIPAPSVLVAAIEHVYSVFSNAKDAKTGEALFTPAVWEKANSLLELARLGYFSDLDDVPMYEKAGFDNHGLQLWKCLRGTNNVEGGPHGDIYRKFGALNGPRFTGNCLTDHRTWYNLQAWATHLFNLDYDYHHDLQMINRTSFLLMYLSDMTGGTKSYRDWICGDLYEGTKEKFGVCPFPESLRIRYKMEPYSNEARTKFNKLNANNDWLRKRENLALPVLPPTTLAAHKHFFDLVRTVTGEVAADGKKKVDFTAITQKWNATADGIERMYVTPEVMEAYSKSWDKSNNIRASQELIYEAMATTKQTARIFAAEDQPFPTRLTGSATQTEPSRGVRDLMDGSAIPDTIAISIPPSISLPAMFSTPQPHIQPSILPSASQPSLTSGMAPVPGPGSTWMSHFAPQPVLPDPWSPLPMTTSPSVAISTSNSASSVDSQSRVPGSLKRRHIVPEDKRKRSKLKSCRRCHTPECPGNNNIDRCPVPCTVPCKTCLRTSGCKGVDNGRRCTFKP
ncbi:hypothetical protein D9611_000435 [Ephemerocybe angulata]|uniref:3'-5' exonuclease n=1 Tax=Ephemerocybe angulata TaxID=980116 RepID=A0A8H5BN82_9AGAR|nr:hypothetical protein D9611_000424 [Tulosesus angulatus]KAF5325697.1 hypothetical protein D9611_000425 [Tulosesus angulatus]KAF5326211.1 hypothetical protein D9611_000434 [Tulosesus angulatus]KAF5326463.1 hypothetical protein D9611_000435 [Tulosesus angulatus]